MNLPFAFRLSSPGNVVYENGVQKLLLTEEGYVTLSDGKYNY